MTLSRAVVCHWFVTGLAVVLSPGHPTAGHAVHTRA